jgi:hypothetical protein
MNPSLEGSSSNFKISCKNFMQQGLFSTISLTSILTLNLSSALIRSQKFSPSGRSSSPIFPSKGLLTHNTSQTKPSLQKKKSVCVVNPSTTPTPTQYIPYIDQMPNVMKHYIKRIVNVDGDGYCGYQVVAESLGLGSDRYGSYIPE